MTMEKYAARDYRRRIGRVLLDGWDPIGVRHAPEAADEYDAYVPGVFRLLLDGAGEEAIAAHLLSIERERMGLDGTPEPHRLAVARALRALPVPTVGARPVE